MTSKRKLYRYAASIIFATREGHCYPVTRAIIDKRSINEGLSQHQRLAELYPHVIQPSGNNVRGVDVLFVQRTTEAGFMPNSHVFPGGVLDDADCSTEWLELFPPENKNTIINSLVHKDRLSLYNDVPTNSIIGELAFRICAIREAFEETGILLARPLSWLQNGILSPCYQSSQTLVDQWREKVCDDANNFVQLFREIKCLPDVWSLVEWSNWLTPENIPRRYNTVFYLCCLDGKPLPIFNPSEVSKAEWMYVDEALHDHQQQHITLPPPQVSELSILNMFPSLHHLHLYGVYKSIYDNRVCLLPRRILVNFTSEEDTMIYSPLPGDDLYPVETSAHRYQCSSEALQHIVTLVKSDDPLYEFTATVPTKSHLITDKMLRAILENGSFKANYVDTVTQKEIYSITGDIDSVKMSKL